MSALRRATERPRVTLVVVIVGAVALVGAGFIGAALAGGDDSGGSDAELAEQLSAERQRSFELESQLEATLRRMQELRRELAGRGAPKHKHASVGANNSKR